MRIGDFEINEHSRVFIVAELSANHNQDLGVALKSVEAAKEAGADAIKLQTYTPDTLTIDCDNEYFQIRNGTIWDGKTLYELYKEAFTPWEWMPDLMKAAKRENLICFSTPFDKTAVDFLEGFHVPAYKIASFEITDIPLIEYVASKGKPVIISTGIAGLEDIRLAVDTCLKMGNPQIILLKCTSAYPARIEDANLRTIPALAEEFNVLAGLSDHTPGVCVPAAAVALGAKVVEKHFILDRSVGGPDATFSLNKEEFKQMVDMVREVEKSLGTIEYVVPEGVRKNRKFTRSLFAVEDIEKGGEITPANVRSIRPGNGLHPRYYSAVMGKTALKYIKRGTPLTWDLIT